MRCVSAGDERSDDVLRLALGAGASEVLRVGISSEASSADVASALAPQMASARFIFCGDYSLDRGSGSVPGFVAGHLGVAQALGAASVHHRDGALHVERRLDRGRRELLKIDGPCVVSVDGGLAPLRRSPLPRVLQSSAVEIPVVAHRGALEPETGRIRPLRPRPRVLNGPDPHLATRQRLLALSGALTVFDPPRVVVASPEAAADELLSFLAARGYLSEGTAATTTSPDGP